MTEQEAMIRLDFIRCALLGGTKPEIIPNEDNVELMDNAIKALEEVQQYRAIGTPEDCMAAVDKQKAKKPNYDDYHRAGYRCQTCNNVNPWGYKHCKHCGQKLDWEGGGAYE